MINTLVSVRLDHTNQYARRTGTPMLPGEPERGVGVKLKTKYPNLSPFAEKKGPCAFIRQTHIEGIISEGVETRYGQSENRHRPKGCTYQD